MRADENAPSREAGSFVALRRRMVQVQLAAQGIYDERVLAAMLRVPRERFVPADLQAYAYQDQPLPIGYGQTISQPYTVAFMLQQLRLGGNERVLEIGTGSGYGAAVLSRLAAEVYSVERIVELGTAAQERLYQAGYRNARVVLGDGSLGLAEFAPYDAIVVTAGAKVLPLPLANQLAEGGRMVIPIGPTLTEQHLFRFTKCDDSLDSEDLGAFAFVPLIGEFG